jgi:pilus assembly protein CpaB
MRRGNMNSKKIWVMAIFAGLIASLLIYSSFIMNMTTPEEAEQEAVEQRAAEEAEQEEALSRGIANPIAEIGEGMRAVSLHMDAPEEGVAGYLKPNSRVDIIAYSYPEVEAVEEGEPEPEEEITGEMILQNVKVLASGTAADSDGEAARYDKVTVEVAPEDGVLLSLASKNSDGFYFMLRDENDEEIVEEEITITRSIRRGGGE